MSAYPVRENIVLLPPEPWRYAHLGEFEILSNAPDAATEQTAARLWRFQALFRDLFPPVKNLPPLPVALLLCGAQEKFNQLIRDGAAPTAGPNTGRGTFLAADADQAVVAVDLEAPALALQTPGASSSEQRANNGADSNDPDGTADDNSGLVRLDVDQLLAREYVHFLFRRLPTRPPVWFAEGIAQLYSRLEISDTDYTFAGLDGALKKFFTQRRFLPFDQFFATGYDSPEFLAPVNVVFPAQALALVQFCLYGRGGKLQSPLFELARRSAREPVTEKIFCEVFHLGYDEMLLALRGYVTDVSYRSASIPLPRPLTLPPIALRDATDAESGRIKGDTLRLAGRHEAARLELLSPYLRQHSDARLLAAIGSLDRAENNPALAQKYFALAAAAGVTLPVPCFPTARLSDASGKQLAKLAGK